MSEQTETKTKRLKLSQAQRRVMNTVKTTGQFECIENYMPARKLLELGLVREASKDSYGRITLKMPEKQMEQSA